MKPYRLATKAVLALGILTGTLLPTMVTDITPVSAATQSTLGQGKTNTSLNLRTSPSPTAKRLTTLPKGTTVTVYEKSKNGWMKVKGTVKGKSYTGWVSGSYVSMLPKPAPKPVPKPFPKPVLKGKTLPYGTVVYDLNMANLLKVRYTKTWSVSTMVTTAQQAAYAIGANYEAYKNSGIICFTDVSKGVRLQDAGVVFGYAYGTAKSKKYAVTYYGETDIRRNEAKQIMEQLLRPYFPKNVNYLVNTFMDQEYFAGGKSTSPKKYDGINVQMGAGQLMFWP